VGVGFVGGRPQPVEDPSGLSAAGRVPQGCGGDGYLARTPWVGVKLPKASSRDMLSLSPAEVERPAASIVEPYGVHIYFAAYSGMRFGEISALKVGRVDLLRGKVPVEEAFSDVAGTLHIGPPGRGRCEPSLSPGSVRPPRTRHRGTAPHASTPGR